MGESLPYLEPFFEVVPFSHTEYRHLGAVKVAIEPWVLILTVVVAAYVIISGGAWYVVAVMGILGARLAAVGRLRRVLKRFVVRYHTGAWRRGTPPHIVAHSLGTYLVGRALQLHPAVHFGRVVFYGCVLRRDWWQRFRGDPTNRQTVSRLDGIWNEIGIEDSVPRLAEALGPRLGLEFGGAGWDGFTGPSVHDRPDYNSKCPECRNGERALVHNVKSPFNHENAFYGSGHLRNAWLPFLLGYEPSEYQYVMRLCANAYSAAQINETQVDLYEKELRDTEWEWCQGQLSVRLVAMLQRRDPERSRGVSSELADRALGLFWTRIALAQLTEAGSIQSDLTCDELDLHIALQRSVELVLQNA